LANSSSLSRLPCPRSSPPSCGRISTQLAAIWRITRKDGQQFFVTDHDRDIVFAGDTYRADAGFERTAIRSDAGFAVDNLDLVGVFAEGSIAEDEVRAGLFDGAEIRVAFVNGNSGLPDGVRA
jgi:hypothetical protein